MNTVALRRKCGCCLFGECEEKYIETSNIKTTISLKCRCSNTALPQRQMGYNFGSLTKDSYVPFPIYYPSEDSESSTSCPIT